MNLRHLTKSRKLVSLNRVGPNPTGETPNPSWPCPFPISLLVVLLIGVTLIIGPCAAKAEETWTLSEAFSDITTGFLAGGNFSYPSNISQADIINAFQPPAIKTRVRAIYIAILERTGSYNDTFTLVFEVRDFDGNIKSIVSAETIDLQTAPTREWISVSLSRSRSDRDIEPGEYLAVHVSRGGPQGGDLNVRPIFRAIVR